MTGRRVEAGIGTMVLVESSTRAQKLKAVLVGIVPDDCIILAPDGWPANLRLDVAGTGTELVMRYMHAGRVFGFRTVSLGFSPAPRQLLFVRHPSRVEEHNLRSSARVSCNFPAVVRAGTDVAAAAMIDISAGGCQLAILPKPGEAPHASFAVVDLKLDIAVDFPGRAGSQPLRGRVRNVHSDQQGTRVGVVFDETDHEGRAAVQACLQALAVSSVDG